MQKTLPSFVPLKINDQLSARLNEGYI